MPLTPFQALVPLIEFAFNPDSFSQTVENLFSLSALAVKDWVHIVVGDDDGLPYLRELLSVPTLERRSG